MSSFRQFCVVHTLCPFGMSKCFEWMWVFVISQKVGRRLWPPCEKLRGEAKLNWHLLLFSFFRATDVHTLVKCHFVDTEPRRLRLKSLKIK